MTLSRKLTEKQIMNRLKKMDALKAESDALKEAAEAIRAEIIAALGPCDIDTEGYRLKYSVFETRGIDTRSLKAAHPELWEQFPKVTETSRFTYALKR